MEGHHSMTDWTSLKYVVVDVEGNGQQPPDLVELAAVPVVGGIIGGPLTWLVRPDEPITPFARRIHGITNEQVADAPVFADIKDQVLAAIDGAALVAHNAHVDVGVLQRKLDNWECPEVFDTLKLARRLLPKQPSYKLGSLVDTLFLDKDIPDGLAPHRATYDALVAARLFIQLTQVHDTTRSLEELRNQPPGGGSDGQPALF
jgi:DNA polymerase III epsilon subunit family exonuclease